MTEPEHENIADPTEPVVEVKKRFGRHIVTRAVVGHSVRFVVASTLATVVPVETRKDKVRLAIAGYALSGIISEKAKEYVCNEIDDKIEWIQAVQAEIKKNQNSESDSDAIVIHTL